jgi:hypothetical protein
VEDEEVGEEGDESTDKGADNELFGAAGVVAKFTKNFGWIHSVVKVREVTGYNIDQTFEINIVEFLNWMAYIKSYNAMNTAIEKEKLNKGKRFY